MTDPTHTTAKTASQETDSLQARIALNHSGSNPVPLHTWISRQLVGWLPDQARVADLGCGTGLLAKALVEELAAAGRGLDGYVGVDPSEQHRAAFAENAPPGAVLESVPLGRWLEGDASGFTAIAAVFSLYYHETDDLPGLLDDLVGRLAPEGRLVVCGPVDPNNRAWFDVLQDQIGVPVPPLMLHESYEYMHDVLDALARAGLDLTVRRYRNSVTMSAEQVRTYWRSVIYHRPEYDEAVDRTFPDGVRIDKEILYVEAAAPR